MTITIIPNPSGAGNIILKVGEVKTEPIVCMHDAGEYLSVFYQLGMINEFELQKILQNILNLLSPHIINEPIWMGGISSN